MNILILVLSLAAMAMAQDTKVAKQVLLEESEKFTAKMFTEVLKEHPGQSFVLSAFSVIPPLAQLSLAAVGESHDDILRAIGLPNDNVTKEIGRVINSELNSIKGVELKTANKIYIADGNELNDDFLSVSRGVFDSEVKNVDFTKNIETANEINTWVEDHTNHRIKDLVSADSLDGNTRAVLVNAIYFKGSWKEKFNPKLTTDQDFYVSKDKTVKVPMMYKKADYKYGESTELNAKLLEILYEGEESSLLIILPNEIDGITYLEEKVKNPALVSKAVNNMFTVEVEVFIPKFKIETQTNLKTVLSALGMEKLFDASKARLDKLLKKESDLYISDAIQKAFIEVTEEGVEAAAANDFGVAYLSAVISESHKFNANRPFLFYLKDSFTLFNGVYQP